MAKKMSCHAAKEVKGMKKEMPKKKKVAKK